MTRSYAFFDIAGTLVDGNPWRGFLKSPIIERWRLVVAYPPIFVILGAKRIGVISDTQFRQIWIRLMAWLLTGASKADVDTLFDWIVQDYMSGVFRADVVDRLNWHREQGHITILLSGMFTELTQAFANHLGADVGIGTPLGFRTDGDCAGYITGPCCAGDQKAAYLQAYLAEQGIDLADFESYAYADSFSDVALLSVANHATATYPDEKLEAFVSDQGWARIG